MPDIHFVREQAYLAGIDPVHESDDCLTHTARLHHPEFGAGVYFVKHYLEGIGRSQGLPNEVCGHILARSADLPVADRALIVEIPRERIVEMHPDRADRVKGGAVLGWATSDVGGPPLPKDPELAGEMLRRWRGLPNLIAFDSWVVIPDRSADNLARRRNGQIVVIDHGHLAGSLYWEADRLPIDDERRHPFLGRLWVQQVPESLVEHLIVASEGHAACFRSAEAELIRWTDALLQDAGDRISLLRFLQERAQGSPARMKRVLNLLT